MLRAGLLFRSLPPFTPFRLSPWRESDRPEFRDCDLGRGDIVRRGGDLVREGVCDLANALLFWRDRVRPLSGDREGILVEEIIWTEMMARQIAAMLRFLLAASTVSYLTLAARYSWLELCHYGTSAGDYL